MVFIRTVALLVLIFGIAIVAGATSRSQDRPIKQRYLLIEVVEAELGYDPEMKEDEYRVWFQNRNRLSYAFYTPRHFEKIAIPIETFSEEKVKSMIAKQIAENFSHEKK